MGKIIDYMGFVWVNNLAGVI